MQKATKNEILNPRLNNIKNCSWVSWAIEATNTYNTVIKAHEK